MQSQRNTSNNDKGFTLIEIMIVLAIFAGIIAVSAPNLFKKNTKIRPIVRKMQLLSKQLHKISRVQNKVFRWVIQIGDPDEETSHSYWVESASGNTQILTEKEAQDLDSEEIKDYQNQFKVDNTFFKKPITLPDEVIFSQVESIYRQNPVEKGKGYIHYFPNGLAEESAIHIKNQKKLNWTVAIHPLTGHATLIKKNIPLEDLSDRD